MATKVKLGTDAQWGVKENGVLGFNDENGVFKAIELASSRASGATYVAESGLIADAEVGVPRIDYTNGVGELLLEPQSTNELTQYNGSDFNLVRCTRGTQSNKLGTIDGYEYSFSSADPNIGKSYTESTLGYKTLSVYFDSTNSDQCRLVLSTGGAVGNGADVTFTPSTETFGSITENATYVRNSSSGFQNMGNGIYRVWLTTEFILYSGGTTFPVVYFGDNTNVWIGGLQVERLSYPTSLIKTSGSAVTRIADAVSGNSSLGQVINSSEGVLYFEGSALADDLTQRYISLSDGTFNNIVSIRYHSVSNTIRVICISSGVTQLASSYALTDITDKSKFALKYKENDFALWVDGVEVLTDTSGSTFSANTLDKLTFEDGSSNNPFYGRVKELKVYDTALTDAELTTLTTL